MTDDLNRRADELLEKARELERERERRQDAPKTACPACGCQFSRVIDGRGYQQQSPSYWRKRKCENCGALYRTEEVARAICPQKKSA